jgi:ABC-type phosphate/phosphonate transport system substrate-binding protein
MYLSHRPGVVALWSVLQAALLQRGVQAVPTALDWPHDVHAHWLMPELLLSQACGYPFIDDLAGKVQLVGCFAYDAPGCTGIQCQSLLVARQAHAQLGLEDFRGMRAAFNVNNSQSGYNAFRALVAPLAVGGRFFASALQTGSHAASVQAVREGRADLASIDCVSYAGLLRYTPQALDGLHIVGRTQAYPGLPLITSGTTSPADLQALQSALQALLSDAAAAPALASLGIVGFERADADMYQRCVAMREAAMGLGYPTLA